MNVPRLALAALAAGVWVVVAGMLMAAVFGYREMKTAFDAVGLAVPRGYEPLVTHTIVRLLLGAAVALLFAIFCGLYSRSVAAITAACFVWALAWVLPYAVIVEWGLFPWSLAVKLWSWSAGEVLIAAWIARLIYRT